MRLPREELRRFIKETPFNRGEVLKLWTKFSYLDKDRSGYLALNVRTACLHQTACAPASAPQERP
jgi:hypothetical protein